VSGSVGRRKFLGLGGAAVGVGVLGAAGIALDKLWGGPAQTTLLTSLAPLPAPYQVPLPIPPVLHPVRTDATTDYYEITQQTAELQILPGLRTTA
jgi:spore coat protein A